MEQTEKLFLELIKKYLGGKAEPCPEADISKLFRLAASHKVMPWIYSAAVGEEFFDSADEKIKSSFKANALAGIVGQTTRYSRFLKLYSSLAAAGITPTVQKGLICDLTYPQRDHRPTSDCDILISPAEFESARRILEESGMKITNESGHETSFTSADGLLTVEVHTSLFVGELTAEKKMEQIFAERGDDIFVEVDGVKIKTFSPTLHLVFLVCHALKHFARSGFGVRQLCDIAVFARFNREEINWGTVFSALKSVNADILFLNTEHAANVFLCIEPPEQVRAEIGKCEYINPEELMAELIDAGVYGSSSVARQNSSRITLSAMEGESTAAGRRASLFPKAEYMKRIYPFLVKFPFLLPLAWFLRIFGFFRRKITRKNAPAVSEITSLGDKRAEMLKKYKMTS